MYLWRRSASQIWWIDHGSKLRALAGNRLALIERPNRKRLQFEVASKSRAALQALQKQFGGRVQKLPRDWLKRSLRSKTKPIKVGNRRLIIPAGAAFGTGEHATTAMSLRFLERVIRSWEAPTPWSPKGSCGKSSRSRGRDRQHARRVRSLELVIDLGTGSGILALAAKGLGAKRVVGIDNDPIAISAAEQNARLNGIRGVQFQIGDVRRWKYPKQLDIITANLFSELLIEILTKLRVGRWLILSGFLRGQERDVSRALRQNKIDIVHVRRRGKWVAVLATCR